VVLRFVNKNKQKIIKTMKITFFKSKYRKHFLSCLRAHLNSANSACLVQKGGLS
jgi:hypothetical protein